MGNSCHASTVTAVSLEEARAALARHDWRAAYDDSEAADGASDDARIDGAWLEVRADAAWWLGRMDDCIASREAAYGIYDAVGDARRAGQCAVWLYEHYMFRAQPSIAGAWLRRARQRLDGDTECAEYGNLVLREVEVMHGRGQLEEATVHVHDALELGRRLRDPDIEAEAQQALGRVLIDRGNAREGLEQLDEAMLLAIEGRLGPYSTGKVYCSLISACEQIGDYRRAAEWTEATSRWTEGHPHAVFFPGLCRVHHAWALQTRGDWTRAEREVMRACAELKDMSPVHAASGYVELGELRRRFGDLAGAEAAFREAEALAGRPQPGLALVRLAQGQKTAATAIITRALDDEPWNRLARARLLPARVQIAVACGDFDAATEASTELATIAADFESPALLAQAASAHGRVTLATGDPGQACSILRHALERWQDLDVPYEVATARLLLAQACRVAGDQDGAVASLSAAQAIFEHLGASVDTRFIDGLRNPSALPGGLTEREAEVLRLVASGQSNKDIAATLSLSERTVARHLSNIFTKTGVGSRSAATAYAYEHGLR
jgi:ATP/maltotriose-dependent transcriptional regulator MalT